MMADSGVLFTTLKYISKEILEALEKMGIRSMTRIQRYAIPKIMKRMDLRGTAKTGSGKTLAFLIPTIEILKKKQTLETPGTKAIIITPTRELAMQIYSFLVRLIEKEEFIHGLLIGGKKKQSQVKQLRKGMDIIVATPGRLLDHLETTKCFDYRNLSMLVIDEADRILDIGFERDMTEILHYLRKRKQTLLFSATKDSKVDNLTKLALKSDLIDVDVDQYEKEATTDGLTQNYVVCPTEKRFLLLYTFIRKHQKKKMMIFFSSCMSCKFHHEFLTYIGMPVLALHGRQNQIKRTNTFNKFMDSKNGILLCTDVAARGLDIPNVDWIVQYDPPTDPKEYIHRVGRTARAGGEGNALLILRKEELGFISYLKHHKVMVELMDTVWTKIADIQQQFEKVIKENEVLRESARKAFKGYVSSYVRHTLKDVFQVGQLDAEKVGKCFGYDVPPYKSLAGFKTS